MPGKIFDKRKFTKRIFGNNVAVGTYISLCNGYTNRKSDGQIYLVVEKFTHAPFTLLKLQPVYGRNTDVHYIIGDRYIWLEKNN